MVLKQFIDHDSSWHAHWPLLSFGMALPIGPRFHSTTACVAVCVHIAIQKILPLSNKRICAGIRVSISSGSAVPCLLNLSTLGLVPCVLAKGSMVGLRRKALHSATAALSGFAQLLLWGALKRRTNWVFSLWDRLYVVQTGFKLMILLLQPSGCCNYCHAPPYKTLLCSVCVCVCPHMHWWMYMCDKARSQHQVSFSVTLHLMLCDSSLGERELSHLTDQKAPGICWLLPPVLGQ